MPLTGKPDRQTSPADLNNNSEQGKPAPSPRPRRPARPAGSDVVILDGGTGSELRRRGVALDYAAWSAIANKDHADLLTDIHCDYLEAGADIITANTFAGSRFVLEAAGLDKQFVEINSRALAAAHQARKHTARTEAVIAASLSCLPPHFDPQAWPDSATELSAYKELVSLFVDEGAELIILEMMQEPVHARLAAEAAALSGLPVWLGLSCRLNETGQLAGYDFPSLSLDVTLDALPDFDFALAAVMHSPPAAVLPALQLLRRRWPGPLGAWAETELTPEEYVQAAATWVQAGAQVLGGCCGTTPAHIAALRARWPAGTLDHRRRAVSQCGIRSCQDDRQ